MTVELMEDTHLENKLVEFKAHYSTLASVIAVLYNAVQNDVDELKFSDVETMITILYEMTGPRLAVLDKIISEFQDSYCMQSEDYNS